jgi:hypothetical protein
MPLGDTLTTTSALLTGAPPVAIAAAGLVASVWEVPSPRHRPRPRIAGGLGSAAAIAFTAIGVLGAAGRLFLAALVLAAALTACAGGLWLARAPGEHGGGGGPHAPEPPPPLPPGDGIDWDAFEHAFESYAAAHGASHVVHA